MPNSSPLLAGDELEDFENGWAVRPTRNRARSHFFVRLEDGRLLSECGHEYRPGPIFGAGNYPRCGMCEAMLKRHGIAPI